MRIDAHVHIGGEKMGFGMTEAAVIEAMQKYQIDYAIVSNSDAAEADHQQVLLPEELQISQEDALDRTLRFARKYNGKIGVAVWMKPHTQGMTTELENRIKENLDMIHAIKIHPYHSDISPIDERVLPYLEIAKKYKLPVLSHTGGCEDAGWLMELFYRRFFSSVNQERK